MEAETILFKAENSTTQTQPLSSRQTCWNCLQLIKVDSSSEMNSAAAEDDLKPLSERPLMKLVDKSSPSSTKIWVNI